VGKVAGIIPNPSADSCNRKVSAWNSTWVIITQFEMAFLIMSCIAYSGGNRLKKIITPIMNKCHHTPRTAKHKRAERSCSAFVLSV
jgi:hypothetical protein